MKDYSYELNNDYDKEVTLNHSKLGLYSKRKFKELSISSSDIVGEINGSCLNKYRSNSTVSFHGTRYKVYKLNKSFKLLNKTSGYLKTTTGEYIKVLKRTYLLIPVLIGLIIVCLFGVHQLSSKHNIVIAQSETSDITYLKGHVYKDDEVVEGVSIDLINSNETIDTTTSDNEGIYFFTGLSSGDYYLKVTYEDIEIYETVTISDNENIYDIYLPSYGITETIYSDIDNIYLGNLASLIENPSIDSNYKLTVYIEKVEEENYENYIAFNIKILLEEYVNGTLIDSYYLDNYREKLEVIISDLRLYDVTNVYQRREGILESIDDYQVDTSSLRFYINQSGYYLIELEEKDFSSKGTTTFFYNPEATYDIKTGTLSYEFKQSIDSTNKTKIKVYLNSNDELIEAGESQILDIGQENSTITLSTKLSKGVYDGILRVYYLDSTTNKEVVDIDIPITIISND